MQKIKIYSHIEEKRANGNYRIKLPYYHPLFNKRASKSLTVTNLKKKTVKHTLEILEDMIYKQVAEDIEEHKSKDQPIPPDLLFKDVVNEWLDYHQLTTNKLSSNNTYRNRMALLLNEVGDIPLSNLTAARLNKFFLETQKNGNYVYKSVMMIKTIINHTVDYVKNFMGHDVTFLLPDLVVPKINLSIVDEEKYLEPEELQTILDWTLKKNYDEYNRAISILSNTGLRFGELVAIDEDVINFEDYYIHVRRTYDAVNKVFTPPKGGDERIAYFSKDTARLLKEQIQFSKMKTLRYGHDKENKLLFKAITGSPMNIDYFNRVLKKIEVNNKKLTSHFFRHTFITYAVQNGMDKELIARQVGHSDTAMIDKVYKHFTNDMEKKQKKAMEDFKIA
jgi:integrase